MAEQDQIDPVPSAVDYHNRWAGSVVVVADKSTYDPETRTITLRDADGKLVLTYDFRYHPENHGDQDQI